MKKRVLSILLCCVLVFSLVACGSAKNETDADKKAAEEVETKSEDDKSEDSKSEEQVCSLKVGMLGVDIKTACIIVAKSLGYFEEENVDVTFEQVSDLAAGITAVSEGKLDILPYGSIPSMNFISQGTDLVVYGGTIAEGSEAIVKAENADKYKTVEELKGKKIGCFRMETGHMVVKGLCREAGMEFDKDVEFIYLESQAAIMEAVNKGEVDLGFVNSGYGYVCKQSGLEVAFRVGEWKEDFPCCRQTTSRESFDSKYDGLVNFETALLRAMYYIETDKEGTIDILSEYSGQDASYVENVIYGTDDYIAAMKISLSPDVDAVADFYELMKANGDIDSETTYEIKDHLDDTIYGSALVKLIDRGENTEFYETLKKEEK